MGGIEDVDKMNSGRCKFSVPLFPTLHFFRDETARGGPEQMALDEALLESAEVPVLRIYRWDGPAVSFGYSQSLAAVRKIHPVISVVRRWTGGGIVEHGSDLTFSLVVPGHEPLAKLRPVETYRLIHETLAGMLGARLVRADETTTGAACFTAPALHDVASADGRKLCGGAQRRTRRGFLHQGSLLGSVPPSVHLAAVFADRVENRPESARLEARAQELRAEKYANPAWQSRIP
jgi:lipoate-protein ligase A